MRLFPQCCQHSKTPLGLAPTLNHSPTTVRTSAKCNRTIEHSLLSKGFRAFPLAGCLALVAVICSSGCGGSKTPTPTTGATGADASVASNQSAPAATTTANGQSTPATTTVKTPVDPQRQETRWIGTIPYDVFYDQPLTVASDATAIGRAPGTAPANASAQAPAMAASSSAAPMPASDASAGDAPKPAAGNKAVDWAHLLPMEVLTAEMKIIRARLTGNLQTVATYNKAAESISVDGAMIAALGAIAEVHPEDETWQQRGKYIRHLGYEIYSNAGPSGRTGFQATEEPFLKLQTAMDGGNLDGLEVDEEPSFAEVVYVAEMMKRIEESFNNLKANINTEARFKEDPSAVERELRMLAALGAMMGTEDYDNAQAAGYQDLINRFVTGAMEGVDALQTGQFEGFREGLNKIQNTCAECHQQYRGSESGF